MQTHENFYCLFSFYNRSTGLKRKRERKKKKKAKWIPEALGARGKIVPVWKDVKSHTAACVFLLEIPMFIFQAK